MIYPHLDLQRKCVCVTAGNESSLISLRMLSLVTDSNELWHINRQKPTSTRSQVPQRRPRMDINVKISWHQF